MQARHIPNMITVARILLVGPVVWSLWRERYDLALGLFFVAGTSDALDGFLAKHFGWTSRLGALLDPLADKALLVSCYAMLSWNGLLPFWLLALVVARDLVIVSGAVAYNFRVEPLDARPSIISKANTFLQILLVLAVLALQSFAPGAPAWLTGLIFAVSISTVWSGLDYVVTWGRRARRRHP
ncbi:MAG TPA: CDP-alcohol phosphatidyltransferase family protein [Gammaproteobacteria bacterium]|nr:CDP-alcohol phosphatidyltransferase family protein [Gammaproteobacteria bacterium]